MNDELLATEALRQKVFQKIADEWPDKWSSPKHGKEFINFDGIKNKNSFYENLIDDIDGCLKDRFGLDMAAFKSISKDSVRRFLDPNYTYGFNERVKDAFSAYIGFQSWEDFVNHQSKKTPAAPIVVNHVNVVSLLPAPSKEWWHAQRIEIRSNPKKWLYLKWILSVAVSLAISLGAYSAYEYWQAHREFTSSELDQVKLALAKRNNIYNPCIATFAYDFSALPVDSVVMYFPGATGYYEEESTVIKSKSGTISHAFYKPGIWAVELRHGTQILKTVQITVKSDGWVAWYNTPSNIRSTLYPKKDYYVDDALCLHPSKIIDLIHRRDYYSFFSNVKNYGISIPDCILEYRIKNSPDEYGISCYDTPVNLIDNNNTYFHLTFTRKGCLEFTADSTTLLPDKNGDTNVSLPFIFDDWHVVRIDFRNGIIKIYIDQKLISQHPYQVNSLKNLTALTFTSKGSCKLDYVKVFDKKEKLIYSDQFEVVPISTIGGY